MIWIKISADFLPRRAIEVFTFSLATLNPRKTTRYINNCNSNVCVYYKNCLLQIEAQRNCISAFHSHNKNFQFIFFLPTAASKNHTPTIKNFSVFFRFAFNWQTLMKTKNFSTRKREQLLYEDNARFLQLK